MANKSKNASSRSPVSRRVIFKGNLMKRSTGFHKSFRQRYLVLYQGRVLVHYDDDTCARSNGEMDLSQVSSITYKDTKDNAKYPHVFDISTASTTWTLGSSDAKTAKSWYNHLSQSAFGNILHCGWLEKRGGTVQSWKLRWFILSDTKILRYYEDEQCLKYKGCLSLNDVSRIQKGEPLHDHQYIIYLTTPSRIWCLCALSASSQLEWMERLHDGKDVINFDEKASIFVNIDSRRCNGNIGDNGCLSMQRIKFVMSIYTQKWIPTQCALQQKAEQLRKYSVSRSIKSNRSKSKSKDSKLNRSSSVRSERAETAESVQSQSVRPHLVAPNGNISSGRLQSQSSLSIPNGFSGFNNNNHSPRHHRRSSVQRKGINDILNGDLKEYNNVHLLNDYHHILEHHHHEKQFEAMYQYLNSSNDNRYDSGNGIESTILSKENVHRNHVNNGDDRKEEVIPLSVLRTFRDRKVYSKSDPEILSDRESLYFGYDDTTQSEEISTQMTLDAIYTHLYWSYHLCRLTRGEIEELEHEHAVHGHHGTIVMEQNVIKQTKRVLMQKRAKFNAIINDEEQKLDLRLRRFVTVPRRPIPELSLDLLSML